MLIWGAMLVPLLTAVVLLVGFRHKTVWWEFTVPVVISFLFVLCSKACVETTQTWDTEYWGGVATKAEFYEAWNERVTCSHTKYCTRSVTRNGKSSTERYACGKQHSYDVDNHGPVWQLLDSNGIVIALGSKEFESLAQRFGSRQFVELNRSYHTQDGNKYVATWDGNEATLEPVFTEHSYENRVQTSNSIFNFQEVAEADRLSYRLFDYPALKGHAQVSILGEAGPTQAAAEALLAKANAKLGHEHQARIFILVFRNQPIQAGILQESYWKRGNKNELVITLGVDELGKVQWAHVFSWTEVEELKIEIRDYVSGLAELNLVDVVKTVVPLVESKWERKHFADFSYLTVEPPTWAVILTYLVTVFINLVLSLWIVHNQHQDHGMRTNDF